MKTIAERLEDLRSSKSRTACIDDRLYAIDGKICELEDLFRPRGYEREWLAELKERQQILDAMQQERRAQDEEEESQLVDLIDCLKKERWRDLLQLIYIEGQGITEAVATVYADHIKRSGKPATEHVPKAHRARLRAIAHLEQLQEHQRQTPRPGT